VSYTADQKARAYLRDALPQDSDLSSRFDALGRDYDDEVDLSEKFMFLQRKRRRLINEAYGNVLEVSVGTGRNMELYDLRPYDKKENASTGRSRRRRVESMTFNDKSAVMVEEARRKFDAMLAKRSKVEQFAGRVEWSVGDAAAIGVLKRPEGGFDTIVQTMGVCSIADAVEELKRLGELVRQPGENSERGEQSVEGKEEDRGGKILLLEHGRGYYEWLNRYLDSGASAHADHYGCWWNKDVGKIVNESGLVVERIRRYHMGTTWEVVLRPRRQDVVK